jgi:hypothetical protein
MQCEVDRSAAPERAAAIARVSRCGVGMRRNKKPAVARGFSVSRVVAADQTCIAFATSAA